jgi:hypothetical protein
MVNPTTKFCVIEFGEQKISPCGGEEKSYLRMGALALYSALLLESILRRKK